MNRREFLLAAAGAAAASTLSFSGRLFAAPANSPRFLLVFLRGGYDCNNLLVPCGSDFYYESRPTLAIAKPDPDNPDSAVALDANWGLNPVVRDTLYPLWQKKQLAFIPFAGTNDLSRSHFETQDHIERGEPLGHETNYRSGFLARLSGLMAGTPAIAFTSNLPLSFQGAGRDIPNISLKDDPRAHFDERQAAILSGMYKNTSLAHATADGLALPKTVSADLRDEMVAASRGAPSAHNFAAETRRIATLMRDQYRLGFVDVGGWDTHVNQGAATGYLTDRLGELGRGLAGFAEEIGPPMWRDTVVVVISEFGRTFRENGDRGTDHGHGSVYWVMGGGINGGRMAGEQIQVAQPTLFQNRDYPVLTDYRAFFGGLIQHVYGLQQASLDRIFAGIKPKDLNLV